LSLGLGDMPITSEIEYISYAQRSDGSFPGSKIFALAAKLERAKKSIQFADFNSLANNFVIAANGILHPTHIEEYRDKILSFAT